jgi:hypothetical protein
MLTIAAHVRSFYHTHNLSLPGKVRNGLAIAIANAGGNYSYCSTYRACQDRFSPFVHFVQPPFHTSSRRRSTMRRTKRNVNFLLAATVHQVHSIVCL